MRWRDAVWDAVRRLARTTGQSFTREQLIAQEMANIVRDTGSTGATTGQTLSRVLQELRDDGLLLFDARGRYRLSMATRRVADVDLAADTQRAMLVQARVGQGRFRTGLLMRWGRHCPLTGIGELGLLRASHIIAWRACASDGERLDPENGLLLSALWDAAFDRGLVSFADDGAAVAYPALGHPARRALRLAEVPKLGRLTSGNRARLRVHRAFCETGEWATT
jgi:hypothetical protein